MKQIDIDGEIIDFDQIDLLVEKDVDNEPGMIIHLKGGETNSCKFPSKKDAAFAWEILRTAFSTEDFFECPGVFFRKEAIVTTSTHDDGTCYTQIGFRGGMLLRIPFDSIADRDKEFAALEVILSNQSHFLQ